MTFQNTFLGVVYISVMAAGFVFLSSPFEYLKDTQATQQINNHFIEMEAIALGLDKSTYIAS